MKCELCEYREIEDVVDPMRDDRTWYVCDTCNKILRLTDIQTKDQFEVLKKAMKDKEHPVMLIEDEDKVTLSMPNIPELIRPQAILVVDTTKEDPLPIIKYTPEGAPSAARIGLEVHLIGKKDKATGLHTYIVVAKFHPRGKDKLKHILQTDIVEADKVENYLKQMEHRLMLFFMQGEVRISGHVPTGIKVEEVKTEPSLGPDIER